MSLDELYGPDSPEQDVLVRYRPVSMDSLLCRRSYVGDHPAHTWSKGGWTGWCAGLFYPRRGCQGLEQKWQPR